MGRADDDEGHIMSQMVKENLKLTDYMTKYEKKLSLACYFDALS
jgi:hypothetical protein